MLGNAALAALVPLALVQPQVFRPLASPPSLDGYVFQQKEFSNLSLRITVHEYRTRAELKAAFQLLNPGVAAPKGLAGFSRWEGNTCRIFVIDPGSRYEPETLGHELAHCLHGQFHPGQERAK